MAIEDPTVGHYSPTANRQGVTAVQRFGDGITDIVAGRKPFTEYDGLVKEYLDAAGNQIRQEYEEATAKAG